MKTVLITGANKSIGFETARQLAQHGYHVIIAARHKQRGEEAVRQLNQQGFTATSFVQMDVTDAASIKTAYGAVASQFAALDVLINNAGISGSFPQPASTYPVEEAIKVFTTNLFAVMQVTQAFLPLLKLSPEPRIVNVTSGLGSLTLHSDPTSEFYQYKSAAYGPSKSALNAWTIVLAYELRDTPFKVNAVDPGYTATDFNQHRGYKTVERAAKPIVQFATIDSEGPTGGFFGEEGVISW